MLWISKWAAPLSMAGTTAYDDYKQTQATKQASPHQQHPSKHMTMKHTHNDPPLYTYNTLQLLFLTTHYEMNTTDYNTILYWCQFCNSNIQNWNINSIRIHFHWFLKQTQQTSNLRSAGILCWGPLQSCVPSYHPVLIALHPIIIKVKIKWDS